jgi:hypothetical protein
MPTCFIPIEGWCTASPHICRKRYRLKLHHYTLLQAKQRSLTNRPSMLPRYSKQYSQDDPERDADSKPLLSQSYRRSSVESEPPHYPPSSSSAPPLPPSAEGRPNVEYTYDPVYPREGERQHALGVLGRTKRVSQTITHTQCSWRAGAEAYDLSYLCIR